jgi:WD40 repeat protein
MGLFTGHTSLVTSVAFLPDGHCIASALWDCIICVWDAITGVMARLGPGPNEGSMVIITRLFLTEPRMFHLMSLCVVLLETGYKLVELV